LRFNSLAFRLFVTAAAWTLLVLPLAGFVIFGLHRADVLSTFDRRLQRIVNEITVDSMGQPEKGAVVPNNVYESLFETTFSGWYWQIKPIDDAGARTLVSASLATAGLPSPMAQGVKADATGGRWMNAKGPRGEPLRLVEVIDSVGHDPDNPRYSVVVAGPLDWSERPIVEFRNRLTLALALAGIGLLAVTVFQVRFGLLPLRQIHSGLAAIRAGSSTRLEGTLPVEIEPLQAELNALIRSNQEVVDRARTHVGNLAHALKTPLAVVTNEVRSDKTGLGAKVAEQAQIMRDSVQHYLERAQMAARVGIIGQVTPVEPVVAGLARTLERIHEDKGVTIAAECPAEARFQGERQDLEEMLGNLLDNACKWSRGEVTLDVEVSPASARARGPRLAIIVADDGPGLTDEQRARIGKRGLQLDETKPGSGLGLSIVIDLAQSYQGSVALARGPNGGLAVHLDLPAA
jgi:signal transduction histidine kinase